MKRFPREYDELRIDLSRDAFERLRDLLQSPGFVRGAELDNLRNVVQNTLDRFDEALLA